jgi:hypothetical protein
MVVAPTFENVKQWWVHFSRVKLATELSSVSAPPFVDTATVDFPDVAADT